MPYFRKSSTSTIIRPFANSNFLLPVAAPQKTLSLGGPSKSLPEIPLQRYIQTGTTRKTDNGYYQVNSQKPKELFVIKNGGQPPLPGNFFKKTGDDKDWDKYEPKAQFYDPTGKIPYPPYAGQNDCGRYATGVAQNNPNWGNAVDTFNFLQGKSTKNKPFENRENVHKNLFGGKDDKEINPMVGEVMLIHPPKGSISGLGGTSLFANRCNFHVSPTIARDGNDYVTSEADAGDKGRSFPYWNIYGKAKKDQSFHSQNVFRYKDRPGMNPTGNDWAKTYLLTPGEYSNHRQIFRRMNGDRVYLAFSKQLKKDVHIVIDKNEKTRFAAPQDHQQYKQIGNKYLFPNKFYSVQYHDGQSNKIVFFLYSNTGAFISKNNTFTAPSFPTLNFIRRERLLPGGREIWLVFDYSSKKFDRIIFDQLNKRIIPPNNNPRPVSSSIVLGKRTWTNP